MDFGSPLFLVSSFLVGLIGMAVFIHGKRQSRVPHLAVGGAMCAAPYFAGSLAILWASAGVGLLLLYALSRND